MLQGTLSILAGASLYAGIQHLHANIRLRRESTDILYTLLFFLLAIATATHAMSMSPSVPPAVSTFSIIAGTLLWCLLPWLTVCLVRIRAGLSIDILSAAWITALLGQLSYPQQNPAAYWNAVSWLMLLTLAHSAFIAVWQLWPSCKPVVRRYLLGLSLPGLVLLVSLPLGSFLFPFGFLFFLLITARSSPVRTLPGRPPVLEQIPARVISLSLDQTVDTAQLAPVEQPGIRHQAEPSAPAPAETGESSATTRVEAPQTTSRPAVSDRERRLLVALADDLTDITVYASMALKRIRKGDADPKLLETLLRRIRSRAVESHRDSNYLSRPDDPGHYRE